MVCSVIRLCFASGTADLGSLECLFTGSMAGVHCKGRYAGSLCEIGIAIGKLAFGTAKAHLGYGLVIGSLGTFMLAAAWLAFTQAQFLLVDSEHKG